MSLYGAIYYIPDTTSCLYSAASHMALYVRYLGMCYSYRAFPPLMDRHTRLKKLLPILNDINLS